MPEIAIVSKEQHARHHHDMFFRFSSECSFFACSFHHVIRCFWFLTSGDPATPAFDHHAQLLLHGPGNYQKRCSGKGIENEGIRIAGPDDACWFEDL